MKDLFVPYEQSLELKNLSFNESCFAYYYHENFIYWIKDSKRQYDDCKNEYFNRVEIACPTFQQAFKFFRDKYKLEIDFTFHTDYLKSGDKNVYEICIQDYTFDKLYLITPLNGYKTYEQAELETIKHLIKIVNEKI